MSISIASGGYVQVTEKVAVDPALNTDGTVFMWLKTTTANACGIASRINNGIQRGWRGRMTAGGVLTLETWQSSIQNRCTITGAVTVNDGAWHPIAFTWRQANGQANVIYVDGTQDVTGNNSASWSWLLAANPRFGLPEGGSPGNLTAEVAGMAWYNTPLSAAEIGTLSNGFAPHKVKPQNLVFAIPGLADARLLGGDHATTTSSTSAGTTHPRIFGP